MASLACMEGYHLNQAGRLIRKLYYTAHVQRLLQTRSKVTAQMYDAHAQRLLQAAAQRAIFGGADPLPP